MKKYLSVLELHIRRNLYKALLVLLILGILDGAVLWISMSSMPGFQQFSYFVDRFWYPGAGAQGVGFSLFYMLFSIANIAMMVLTMPWGKKRHKISYTTQRLRISEVWVLVLAVAVNCLIFAMLYLWQALLMMGAAKIYTAFWDYPGGPQAIAVDFYRNSFLHGIFPMEDSAVLYRNCCFILICAVSSALSILENSKSTKDFTPIWGGWIGAMVIARIRADLDYEGAAVFGTFMLIIALGAMVYGLYSAHKGKAWNWDHTD